MKCRETDHGKSTHRVHFFLQLRDLLLVLLLVVLPGLQLALSLQVLLLRFLEAVLEFGEPSSEFFVALLLQTSDVDAVFLNVGFVF